MGAWYRHFCTECGYEVRTSGPWEFYRDEQGRRKPYGHPVPCSEEALLSGIRGLSGTVYCLGCHQAVDVILVEFSEPARQALDVWSGRCEPEEKYGRPGASRCPNCDSAELLLAPDQGISPECPRCSKGRLVGTMEAIS